MGFQQLQSTFDPFCATNSISYEKLHNLLKFDTSMRLLRLKVWPQNFEEVAKVRLRKYNKSFLARERTKFIKGP